ncbi:MAG: hypothetical protein ACI9N0_002066 [Ilumatobacter sp.]|jgi:hypothetical protein
MKPINSKLSVTMRGPLRGHVETGDPPGFVKVLESAARPSKRCLAGQECSNAEGEFQMENPRAHRRDVV